MKKSLFILLAVVATVIASCSKDAKINRRIDGEWKVVSIGGASLDAGETITFKFAKDTKLDGDGTLTWTDIFGSDVTAFTYTVSSGKITMMYSGYADILTVSKYERKKIELIDSDSEIWVLDPK